MNSRQIDLIAAAINQLRAGWSVASIQAVLNDKRIRNRPARDVAAAMAWIATDEATRKPTRILEAGPWWPTGAEEVRAIAPPPFKPEPRPPLATPEAVAEAKARVREAAARASEKHQARARQRLEKTREEVDTP